MRFDINRSSLCAHCSVAIRRRKFLVYFLLRLPAHFQPGQLQPKQHGDAWSDPANRRGYDVQNYSLDEKMLAITDELFPPLLSRAYNSDLRNTKQSKYWNSRHHPWLNFLKKEKKILEMVSTHLEGNSAWRLVTRSVLSSLIQPGNCEGWPNIRDVPVVQKPAARSIPTPFRPHLARISFTNHFSSGGRGRPLSFSTQSHSRIDTRCGFSWTVLESGPREPLLYPTWRSINFPSRLAPRTAPLPLPSFHHRGFVVFVNTASDEPILGNL